jgi:hypothetical protein
MIDLPLKVKATGHNCVPASVTMVCAYWRKSKPTLKWKLPEDINSSEWTEFFKSGFKYVKASGMPTNSIQRYLKSLSVPLNARLEHMSNSHQLLNLLNVDVPIIVFYNQDFYLKGEKGIGHAAVVVDKTEETFVTVDAAFYPKCIHQIPKKVLEEAWEMEQKSAIIISPKSIKFSRVKIPSRTIPMYSHDGVT